MTGTLDKLIGAVAERRRAGARELRGAYTALVVGLASGQSHDPEQAAELLHALGRDERQLRADVERVLRHRQLVAEARELPGARETAERAAASREAVRVELRETTARLEQLERDACRHYASAAQELGRATAAQTAALAGAPPHLAAVWQAADRDVADARAVLRWVTGLGELAGPRAGTPPERLVGVRPETEARLRSAWAALVASGRELAEARRAHGEAEAGISRPMNGGVAGVQVGRALIEAEGAAETARERSLVDLVAAANDASAEAEQALPALERAAQRALEAALSADCELFPEVTA